MEPTIEKDLLTIKEACNWVSSFLGRDISESNISYLVQYGKVKKHNRSGGTTFLHIDDLKNYYFSNGEREKKWKQKLGDDLNWALSFDHLREKDTTKHVHRLHPYKGKFIPQLVQYFIDDHTDSFKRDVFFQKGDIILDPFCGSGTTLVQANELGIHAIGVDVSAFNALISNIKVGRHQLQVIYQEIQRITRNLKQFLEKSRTIDFEVELLAELQKFNAQYFPSPEFKYQVQQGQIDEFRYGAEQEQIFLKIYQNLIAKYDVRLAQPQHDSFLDRWYLQTVREEIDFMFEQIKPVKDIQVKRVLSIILSRTIRSCRVTTHSDLATLKRPQLTTYYCKKHGKICKPLFSILSWWQRYAQDTIERLQNFEKFRTNTHQICITGDSREVDIFHELKDHYKVFAKLAKEQKIKGIFSSPPYVGLIDYHEQHAYAYDLFGFERQDSLEIGPLYKGQGAAARKSYVEGIAAVLQNCKKYLADDFSIFLVANDKWGLYPEIAEKSGLKIVQQFKRPVLNRTERDKGAYSESIFHLKTDE